MINPLSWSRCSSTNSVILNNVPSGSTLSSPVPVYTEDEVFLQDLDQCVTEIENDSNSESFSCSFCTTICKSKRGLTRHINIKHMEVTTNSSGNSTKFKNGQFDRSVDLECFGGLLGNSLKKIRLDECLPSSVLNEYRSSAFLPGDISYAFKCVETVICKFCL